ncbi:MAG: hypothetical protein IAG10_31970 [Planctomycetaceae bacterium]|nr:hypothetical protein [Planctomycetaceae bacterium]
MPATKSPPKRRKPLPSAAAASKVTAAQLAALRERSRQVRADVAAHRAEIEAEGDRVIAEGLAAGSLVKVSVLLKGGDDSRLVQAIDEYAEQHGLQSRSHVVRVALAKLLKLDVTAPKWGWRKGRARKEPTA